VTANAPEQAHFASDGRVPNSPLPVLIYRGAEPGGAAALERLFGQNAWTGAWRNGIYPFHHFHSTSHEVLGIASGSVTVRLGGASGQDFILSVGDIAVLPAGTGHKRLACSPDLLVVGAYPDGCDWDLIKADEVNRATFEAAQQRIAQVRLPSSDPVFGAAGSLVRLWRASRDPSDPIQLV
jgi:uncharacterized protein YjlB